MSDEPQEYTELLKKYKQLQMELELTNQTLYDCRRHMKTAQTIEAEYQEEIKVLQSQGTLEQQRLEAKVHQLTETISNLKASYNERINCLEKELVAKDAEVKELKKDIDDIIKITGKEEPVVDEKLLDEICELRQHNDDLHERVNEFEKCREATEQQNLALQETIKQLQDELQNYKETLDVKREEVEEANHLIQNLKDDYLCVKSELDLIRSKPLDDQSKGNSLFAEVDDRRLQLQQNINTMKTKYLEMKRERASYLKQITTLRNENATLMAQWEAEIEGRKSDEEMILDTYKSQIQTLNDLVDSYQKELKEKSNCDDTMATQGTKFFDNMMSLKNKEIEDLRQKLTTRSLNHTSLSYDLAEANRQIRKYNLESSQLKNEIGQLKVKIQEMEMTSPPENAPEEVKGPKSIFKSTRTEQTVTVSLDETNKENDVTSRKVQFSEGVVEPQMTDRSKLRKGAKVLLSKPIKYA